MHTEQRLTLSIDEAASRTGLSRSFLYEQIKAGALSTIKVGKRRLVHVQAVDDFLSAHAAGAAMSGPKAAA